MAERDGQLREVLDGYAKFLQDKNLAMERRQPYHVRWVREFLLFARAAAGYSFEHIPRRYVMWACPVSVADKLRSFGRPHRSREREIGRPCHAQSCSFEKSFPVSRLGFLFPPLQMVTSGSPPRMSTRSSSNPAFIESPPQIIAPPSMRAR